MTDKMRQKWQEAVGAYLEPDRQGYLTLDGQHQSLVAKWGPVAKRGNAVVEAASRPRGGRHLASTRAAGRVRRRARAPRVGSGGQPYGHSGCATASSIAWSTALDFATDSAYS